MNIYLIIVRKILNYRKKPEISAATDFIRRRQENMQCQNEEKNMCNKRDR